MFISGLLQLHRATNQDELERLWRQSMASLGAAALDQRPAPLEGLPPDALLAGVRIALSHNLVDNLDWLSAPAAAVALYELAAAIPVGPERHQLGRRVAMRLRDGNAATFVALATALAISSRRGLAGPDVQARVALALELPLGSSAQADALALALVSRPQLETQWLSIPSTGSLPSRRLAARLLERAARQAAMRASQGDVAGLRIFETPSVKAAWERLLQDRESLVWGHVAAARGLLCEHVSSFEHEINRELRASGSIGEWRRAATSLTASIALRPDWALERCQRVLSDTIAHKDPGITAAMVLGIPRAAEVEPEAAEELLNQLVTRADVSTAEALVELRQHQVADFGSKAFETMRERLEVISNQVSASDLGLRALCTCLMQELCPDGPAPSEAILRRAKLGLECFAEQGASSAGVQAKRTLDQVQSACDKLNHIDLQNEQDWLSSFQLLRNLDMGLLKKPTLRNLLRLDGRDNTTNVLTPLDRSMVDLCRWLMRGQLQDLAASAEPQLVWHQHRLRTLLHLVDSDWSTFEPGQVSNDTSKPGRAVTVHQPDVRRTRVDTTRSLLTLCVNDPPPTLHRILFATSTRAFDALIRDELCEVSDALLVLMGQGLSASDLEIIAEASMLPELKEPIRRYALLMRSFDNARRSSAGSIGHSLETLATLVSSLSSGSPRLEALRHALVQLLASLDALLGSRSLAEAVDQAGTQPLSALKHAVQTLVLLCSGARRRIGISDDTDPLLIGKSIHQIELSIQHSLRGDRSLFQPAVTSAVGHLQEALPTAIADLTATILVRMLSRQDHSPAEVTAPAVPKPAKAPSLPPWLPPGRTLGGFYVVKKLGSGGVASVFVAKRAEERHQADAKRFALKIPEYSGGAARTLSEAEFNQMFREEAGALLALPDHPNLSKFVTFDAGVKPKPILVMELIEGISLERAITIRDIDTRSAFKILDGIGAGLEAMHDVRIAHLDVKPSNVILRPPEQQDSHGIIPVLVDFGLAGTRLRPGCATTSYGAPEIWSLSAGDSSPAPMPADVYAFACLAFELLTGQALFDASSEVGIISLQISHDGIPPGVAALGASPAMAPLAAVLTKALRRDPRQRCTIQELRSGLTTIGIDLHNHSWPLK